MIVADFSLQDKLGKVQFFEETFFLANTSMNVVLGKPFFTLSDADIRFAERNLVWRRYYTLSGARALEGRQQQRL